MTISTTINIKYIAQDKPGIQKIELHCATKYDVFYTSLTNLRLKKGIMNGDDNHQYSGKETILVWYNYPYSTLLVILLTTFCIQWQFR